MYVTYHTPEATYSRLYAQMLTAGHILIAGAAGSGKSVLMTGLVHTALIQSPVNHQLIIVDPKRVDYSEYRALPHVVKYASEPKEIVEALKIAISIMEDRYNDMARRRLKEYDKGRLFVVVDELADLMTDKAMKRVVTPLLQRLTQLGRAARVSVIAATQCILSSVISTEVKVNFVNRIALRTATAQDSRNIISVKGAEMLPDPRTTGKAYGYWRDGANMDLYVLPKYDDAERMRIINHWMDRRNTRKSFGLFGRKSA